MRDANVEAAARRVLAPRLDHRRPRMLLEDVPDHLDGVDVVLALHQLHSLVQPADRWPEGRAPGADLPLPLERAERLPELGLPDLVHLHVMNLQNIDVVRLQAAEALVDGKAD